MTSMHVCCNSRNMCCGSFFSNDVKANNINYVDFRKLLTASPHCSFFNFEWNNFKQIDGVAMGSPLGPTLANAFFMFSWTNLAHWMPW